MPNDLAKAASAYLRSAMHQPVDWQPWSDEAFAQAAREDKPILLDIGAVWCHWCHVMDRESYEDPNTAGVINHHFIAIKVDRDERPDVDTRYQAAVAAISGQGGWPLTAFLTPEGRPYFGGTYFPPEERYGRPSFQRVLLTMAAAFENTRGDVEESASSVLDAIAQSENFTTAPADLDPAGASLALVQTLITGALTQFDPIHGGFGSQPKFPNAPALDLLLDAASRPGEQAKPAEQAVLTTLKKMSRGGIFDQLAGGFHRYSVDERWVVPHFEKMAYDNATLLSTYAHALQTFPDPEIAETVRATLRWMTDTLADREQGGFYASQDADLSLDDDGNYFTWTRAEAAAVLDPGELKLAEHYYDIGAVGDMHHDPSRNVLFRPHTLEQAAQLAGMPAQVAPHVLASATKKLQAARQARPTPFVDKTLYIGWNGLCISAFIAAGRVTGQAATIAFAARSLDRALTAMHLSEQGTATLNHVIAYSSEADPTSATTVPGTLDDYTFLAHACLDTWEATGEPRFYNAAEQLAETLLAHFYDGREAGFFDTPTPKSNSSNGSNESTNRIGALIVPRKPIQDAPTPAGNPSAAALLLRLHALNGRETYRDNAQETLEAFAPVVEHLGLYASTFGLALARLGRPPVQVVIVGEGSAATQMELIALTRYAVNKTVIRLRPDQLTGLPPALAETIPNLPATGQPTALICTGFNCQLPITDTAILIAALNQATDA